LLLFFRKEGLTFLPMPQPPIPYTPAAACPLDGIRVIDLSRLVAGNMLSVNLADFGAEVVKIEARDRGDTLRDWLEDGVPLFWKVYARNKKSVTLDIRNQSGRDLLKALAAKAQVLIESFRPGVMERLGLGPAVLHEANPALVIVRISGWGQTGPYAQRPGFGSLVEGISGFAAKNGFADKPPALPNLPLADMVAGLSGAFAVMVALREVELKAGAGQVIDLSLLEPLLSTLSPDVAEVQVTGRVKPRSGNRASITAPRNVYQCRCGRHVALSTSIEAMARRLFTAIGRPELIDDPRFATNAARLAHVEALDSIIQTFIGARDRDEVLAFFAAADVTVGPVYDASELLSDPHIAGRAAIVELQDETIGSLPMHNVTPRLSATPGALRTRAPHLGEHTRAILAELGLDSAAIDALAAGGVI
jgi:crotonobetainyl-CoA:carnitine CoA-transferase CaiB-like acyl-CoA transferase